MKGLSSMTGFGSAVCREEGVSVSVELKTVNNRFFKLALRIADAFAALEPKIESAIHKSIERGTVNVAVKIRLEKNAADAKLCVATLRSYYEQLLALNVELGTNSVPRLDQLALLPGVVELGKEQDGDSDSEHARVWPTVEKALEEAMIGLQQMRRTEGASMAADLKANIESLHDSVKKVERQAPEVVSTYQRRLAERIGKLAAEQGVELAGADFAREVALFADRCDISEETVRFRSHLEQFASVMAQDESCGKKLDFLTQELFRETNTMGTKANDAEIIRHVVEMKTVIERIREMVQNIE